MKKRIIVLTLLSVLAVYSPAIATNTELPVLAKDDDAFLETIERQAFDYFWQEVNPKTGIVYDANTKRMGGSISSVGFALSAICVADSRGWISHNDAYNRVLTTLKCFHRDPNNQNDFCVDGYCGLFFHFVDTQTGKWYKNADCVSTADTAALIAGIITCMEYFKGTEVERIGDDIVRACEWDSFLKDENNVDHKFIAMGFIPPGFKSAWTNEKGLFGRYYGYMDNSFLTYILGIASPTHPIPVSSWYACQSTYKRQTYNGKTVIVPAPPGLAFHYYQHCWMDLRNKKDQVADYFENSFLAVLAQREYCLASGNYPDGLWGISSSLSPRGYEAMSAPFGDAYDNGTITPYAIAGGIVFAPSESLDALKYLCAYYDNMIMGKYGLTDALNIQRMWASRDYLGIDQGVIVLMIENFRSQFVWRYFMRNRYIEDALKRIGFVGVIEDFENDTGGGTYSIYRVSSLNAIASRVSECFMEGERSLRLDPRNSGKITITFKPDLTDFTYFKYISIWARGAKDVIISLTDKENKAVTLGSDSFLDSAGWRRYFYSLDKIQGLRLSDMANIALTIIQADKKGLNPVYIDGVELVYDAVKINPPPVSSIALSPFGDLSICKVSFNSSPGAHRYDIRYSVKSMAVQADFEQSPPAEHYFFAKSQKEEFFVPIKKGGKYYIGIQAIDNMGQRSDVKSAGPVTVKGDGPVMMLDDFERGGVQSEAITWPAHSSYTLSITSKRASRGKRSLEVQYYKLPTDSWDHLELVFKKPLDVRPFKYLKLDVFGDDAIIAKLYNTKEMQEEIGVLRPLKKDMWNELIFDIAAMPGDKIDKSRVTKLLLFIAPGRSAAGTMYIDNIRIDN